jgi:hypothetical protein
MESAPPPEFFTFVLICVAIAICFVALIPNENRKDEEKLKWSRNGRSRERTHGCGC